LDHPEVTTVIPGASNPGQVKSNVAASELESLSPDVHEKLYTYYETEIKPLIRGHY
jgi:aryl-alcohol dehydrogenase-like predicted oxidoreductase